MTNGQGERGRIELLQGTLDLLILQTLRWGPQHGYQIAQMLRANSRDILRVDAGSLYPCLHRLEKKRWIAAAWTVSDKQQRVRTYRLTPIGRKRLVAERSRWEQFSAAIALVLGSRARESES